MRSDESGPVRADEIADEDMVQEAEELRHVFGVGALRAFVAKDFRLLVVELMRKRRRQNRSLQFPWTVGSLGNPRTEHMILSWCSFCEIARA